jgi:hypothetical protein
MKKLLIMGVLALGASALTQQEASAWCNVRFGIGANLHWQSGGNNLLWGAFRNSQPPGPEYGSTFPGYPGGVYGGAGFGAPGFGAGVGGGYYPPPAPAPFAPVDAAPEAAAPVSSSWYQQRAPHQTVTFYPGAYQMQQYYYPASYYYYGR